MGLEFSAVAPSQGWRLKALRGCNEVLSRVEWGAREVEMGHCCLCTQGPESYILDDCLNYVR